MKKAYSFELNTDVLQIIHSEFDVQKVVDDFAQAISGKSKEEIEAIGKQIFENYGKGWMSRAHQLGDEYPDRTSEVLLETIDKCDGYYKFALLPQRFIEIAYLGINDQLRMLPIVENSPSCLTYRMNDCSLFKALKEKCGDEVASLLPCQHACLAAIETIHNELDIEAIMTMDASMVRDGYCQFSAAKPGFKFSWQE